MKKIQEVIQNIYENLSQFLDHLTKALLQYTNLDPETTLMFMIYFFSWSFSDIWAKLKHIEKGTLMPQSEAFKAYHGRDEKVPKQKYLMLAKAF